MGGECVCVCVWWVSVHVSLFKGPVQRGGDDGWRVRRVTQRLPYSVGRQSDLLPRMTQRFYAPRTCVCVCVPLCWTKRSAEWREFCSSHRRGSGRSLRFRYMCTYTHTHTHTHTQEAEGRCDGYRPGQIVHLPLSGEIGTGASPVRGREVEGEGEREGGRYPLRVVALRNRRCPSSSLMMSQHQAADVAS